MEGWLVRKVVRRRVRGIQGGWLSVRRLPAGPTSCLLLFGDLLFRTSRPGVDRLSSKGGLHDGLAGRMEMCWRGKATTGRQ